MAYLVWNEFLNKEGFKDYFVPKVTHFWNDEFLAIFMVKSFSYENKILSCKLF